MTTKTKRPQDFLTFLRRVHYIFGLMAPLFIAATLFGYWQKYNAANDVSDWFQTKGSIIDKNTVMVAKRGSGGHYYEMEQVRVVYKYRVGAETFTGSQIYAGRGSLYDPYLA